MRYTQLFDRYRDILLLIARVLLMSLFVIFGWDKFMNFSGTAAYMESVGLPLATLAALSALIMELVVGLAILVGLYTRPLALLLALYTLLTALIGHKFWELTGGMRLDTMIHFYKNMSIAGGLLLLCLTGPGKYSIDRR
ncbi:DoxX family protein [Dyella psychrodurans]|uniref:DoxX family protein n=1 Tax=Dyella psychrodurans TaxID=1927960 RepID=A0A370X7U5_9GAMM|nr:DoxX family protein [Dyella psychrodurans]RDS84285.1 DoxX family protein [Dyella psychrodurans]